MVSYFKKMVWGDPAAANGASGEETKDGEGSGPAFTGTVTPD